MKIKVFTTGGTIDKIYEGGKGTLNFSLGGYQAFKQIAEDKVKLNLEYSVERILAKDSLEITDADREKIKEACEAIPEDKILITHGTDTMTDTAQVLNSIQNKVIVLTGSSQPYKFRDSDAEFNIGVAVGALNLLENGVYIAMNGRIYKWDKCEKRADGLFVDKN